MMLFTRFIILSILIFNYIDDLPKDRSLFISPVRIPLALSANFGELRIDHFHSGLDIKTQGVTGQEVVAAASGYVFRISVSPGGFGRAIYLRHPSGYSTVYGHLERFTPEIDEYVKKCQYENRNFTVNLFPPADKFKVKQGDLIAYSGNSGGSTGPHLHYEVRKSDSEAPINPLLFDFGISDDIKPVIERLIIYPAETGTLINGRNKPLRLQTTGVNGNYNISNGDVIKISGKSGFGIKSYDQLNDSYNKCAVYSIVLKVDSNTIYRYVMDKFAFTESRYVNSHIDYESFMRENTYYERAFVLPGDRLGAYKDLINRGIYNFCDSNRHMVEIILEDINKNRSVLRFSVQSAPGAVSTPIPSESDKIPMVYNRSNRFRADNITITIPAGALYDTMYFSYRKEQGTPLMYSDVHYVHNRYTPVQKAYSISIKPNNVPAGKASKMLIVQMDENFAKSSIGGSWTEDFITADAMSFGMFFVGIDTVPPGIYTNGLTDGEDLSGRKELRIRIGDDLSGIKSYEPLIDGKWALFEYDLKNNLLIYRFDASHIEKNTMHRLVLKVTDNRDNQNEFSCQFKW